MGAWKLFYDGGCNLCHTSKLKAEKWAERAKQPMEVDFLQSEEAVNKGYQGDVMVLEKDGTVFYGADAWLEIMTIAPWYLRWLSAMRKTPPTRALARFSYGIVARIRYKIWGTRSCPLPPRVSKPPTSAARQEDENRSDKDEISTNR